METAQQFCPPAPAFHGPLLPVTLAGTGTHEFHGPFLPVTSAPTTEPIVHPELAAYLKSRPQIHPIRQTLSDPSLWWAATWLAVSSFAFMSGLEDPLEVSLGSNKDYPVFLQKGMGALGLLSALSATDLIATGRYQTYKDMADFQRGVDPGEIVARGDASKKGMLSRFFNWRMHHAYHFLPLTSVGLCVLMTASGIANKHWGEAMTGLLLLPGYAAQLMPEKYRRDKESTRPTEPKEAGWLKRTFNAVAASAPGRAVKFIFGQPLLLSALLMSWRLLPALGGAIYHGNLPLAAMYGLSVGMLVSMANTTKDAIGRYHGSILDPKRENGLEIAKTLLEGRFFRNPQKDAPPKHAL